MRARRTDSNQTEIVQVLRDAGHTVTVLSHVGNGIPDTIIETRRRNRRFWLEIKMPGEKLSKAEAELFPLLPGEWYIARSIENALETCEGIDYEYEEDDV